MESGAFFVTHTDKSQRSRQPKLTMEEESTATVPKHSDGRSGDTTAAGSDVKLSMREALPTGNSGGFLGIGPSIFPARGFVLLSRVGPPFRCCSSSAFASFGLPTFEPIRRQLSVERGRLNVAVPEIALQGPGVLALIRELETAGMAEHVRVDRKRHSSEHPDARKHLAQP